ncbi:hypothetical protein [Saccharothrix lopnurensis]|uniref:Terminase n=1 Tax=Saccharothrix lopnurensis TaxID=1670621 RepID=A0ABW1P5I0_9PSEU
MTTATSAEPSSLVITPHHIGPTWQRGDDGRFVLPEYTLGWQQLAWCRAHLKHGDGRPWTFTREQARWWLWWWAVDEHGKFLYTQGVLQRLKGWGKDPVGSVLAAVELVGPSRPDLNGPTFRDPSGREHPGAKPHPEAWVQVAAVTKRQTKNTLRLFPQLFTKATIAKYGLEIHQGQITANGGAQLLEAVTSNPDALEGARCTFPLKNETHRWREANRGHDMAEVIDNNSTKSADGSSRPLAITNAYDPAEDSVAQREREAYEEIAAGHSRATGFMYDSLEAPPDAPLTAEAAPAVLEAVRGDAVWLPIPRMVNRIMMGTVAPSRARRFWYNQIETAEDAWADWKDWELCRAPDGVELLPGDEITLFLDCSKSNDATALVGCRISDGLVVVFGMWKRPPGRRGFGWLAPRGAVEARVDAVFEDYSVLGFFADPSHTLDDETQDRYWDNVLDRLHRRYHDRLKVWATRGGSGGQAHSVMWDMTAPSRVEQFTDAAMLTAEEIEQHEVLHDGDARLRLHVRNARNYPNKYGTSMWKGAKDGPKKIDLAVAMVGARMVRRLYLNRIPSEKNTEGGQIWGR